jgi:hypothetical protein
MEQEQIEEFGISIYEFDNLHYVKIHSERHKSIVNLTLYNICENIYSDFGRSEDWELFIDLYSKLSEKVRKDRYDRTITL